MMTHWLRNGVMEPMMMTAGGTHRNSLSKWLAVRIMAGSFLVLSLWSTSDSS